MTSIFYSGLSKDFSLLLNNADDFNVIIQVGEVNNTKEFRAHSVILRARSPYFKSALSNEWITKRNDMIVFNKPNITPLIFDMVLKYIYTGELNLKKYSGENILELLIASDELILEELFEHIQDYLINNQTSWIQENFVLVLHTVFKLVSCKKLQDYCLESICTDPRPFITSKNFPSLDKDILYGLLKRDDMQIDEVSVWDSLIKWGIEQTPGLGNKNNDRTKWNNINYEALKKTLNQFIPHIRFVEISPSEYFDKVRPYKAIIPNHIYEEIEEFYFKGTLPKTFTLSPRVGKIRIESDIIKPILIPTIINWINKREAKSFLNKNDSSYKFNLIYRGSIDGIDSNLFRNRCKSQEPILILVKCQNLKKIFGGYTPVGFYRYLSNSWNNNYYIYSTDSFIFSFEDNDDNQNMKISRVTSHNYAIYNNYYDGYGFSFGSGDLYMEEESLCVDNSGGYYEHNLNSYGTYTIEEIEAFRVVKQ
ncbi:uncharacterized protein OCT59_006028 [Rhizophagus irregularis]|uniref:Uncharacterized protein n=3 Tax=Rhizophagus irregularis TaxID=588596 RepID=U9UP01_RHIID|nr:hypothetical protein GLOIN_2v1778254 [Rhizophagus irregularis DAOM 181602=DAOM 197198]EXX61738.1 hypothetical protein RirG_168410 [Rhizophagus irregularis DAOM 197198w]POG68461.1 hypothetical protein GLOIN_2v1778254 [Rhizophagus irregularis DAOM 181602=DAOM 197198]UZO14572.1 hypothetical protein OCT59_006028 [Rhizophagus irregularis]|eukprot:XP_025175327.1 hypothetical protein GLOIN_2v1778254 [Rhizophagus irregularis DAOM 181602=DAOM 197198]